MSNMKFNFNIILLIIIIIIINNSFQVESFGFGSIKKLKQKAKDAYKKKFGRDKTWHFLGFDLSEYPGTNEKYREINKEKWEAYYLCLKELVVGGEDLTQNPEAILGFESNSIGLECKLCLSPLEMTKLESAEWLWAPVDSPTLQPVDYTEHILLHPEDRTLKIYNLQTEHTGQYICQIGEAQAPPYFLTVVNNYDENIRKVHSEDAPLPPYPLGQEVVDGYDLVLDTEWGPWSECSKCNQIGRRHRFGYCIVKYQKSMTFNYSTLQVGRLDYDLLSIFKLGIPCNSHVLPYSIKRLSQLQNRSNEVMTGYCKVDCPDEEVFQVRDKNGNIIEEANNSAGIYSMLQGPPQAEPSVERTLMYGIKGKKVVITCPGNLNSDVEILWQIGSKKVVPDLLVAKSKGRIYVSITDKIHIQTAKLTDSKIYSCWQRGQLSGTVRLIVEKRMSLDFNHHIMLLGMVLIAGTFLYVFIRAFFGRRFAKGQT